MATATIIPSSDTKTDLSSGQLIYQVGRQAHGLVVSLCLKNPSFSLYPEIELLGCSSSENVKLGTGHWPLSTALVKWIVRLPIASRSQFELGTVPPQTIEHCRKLHIIEVININSLPTRAISGTFQAQWQKYIETGYSSITDLLKVTCNIQSQ